MMNKRTEEGKGREDLLLIMAEYQTAELDTIFAPIVEFQEMVHQRLRVTRLA